MLLVGMLDSPFVRRVAVSFQLLGLPFKHQSTSVFRDFPAFQAINPVVKSPSLVCDDGTVLMDSTLILAYAEALAHPRTLLPADIPELRRALRVIGLGLAACEKTAQVLYERGLRPPEKWHQPWLDRVTGQLLAAYRLLEAEVSQKPLGVASETLSQAGITAAVAWYFTQQTLPEVVAPERFPALVALSAEAEQLAAFRAAPYGDDIYAPRG